MASTKKADKRTKAKTKASKYTDPELREKLKKKIKKDDKGGKKGQWSARKSQLLVKAYEKKGGGYTRPQDDAQRHLSEWTAQDWQTQDGAPAVGEETTKRYLPEQAWAELDPADRAETEEAKDVASQDGEQFAANPSAAKAASARARRAPREPLEGYATMTVAVVRSHLGGLDRRTLTRVRDHEQANKARKTVLDAVGARLAR